MLFLLLSLHRPDLSGASQQAQVQQQLALFSAMPYGDATLVRNLDGSAKREEKLKPTNPAAQRASLAANAQFRVSPRPTAKIKPKPLPSLAGGKSQLFEGLEDDDFSFGNDTFVPRRSVKKLVIKGSDSSSLSTSEKRSQSEDGESRKETPTVNLQKQFTQQLMQEEGQRKEPLGVAEGRSSGGSLENYISPNVTSPSVPPTNTYKAS